MEIQEIKQGLSILSVLSHYGLHPGKHGMLCCPFHEDKTPSLKVYEKTNTFNCFGCGATGDVIEFIQLKEKCSKHGAIVKARTLVSPGYQPAPTIKPTTMEDREEKIQLLTRMFGYFRRAVSNSKPARDYITQTRKLGLFLEIGYNSAQFHHAGRGVTDGSPGSEGIPGGKDMDLINLCVKYGLLTPTQSKTKAGNPTGYYVFGKNCTVFPLKDKQQQITGLYFRSIADDTENKHYYLKGREGLYPNYPKPETTKLILTEAIIDAATLLQIPKITEEYSVLACYGTNGFTPEHKEAIKELVQLKEVTIFFDGDKTGREAAEKTAKEILQLNENLTINIVNTPDGEDINSLLQGHSPEIFPHLLETRELVQSSAEVPFLLPEKENTPQPGVQALHATSQKSKLNTRNPDYITYATEGLQIIILGGINLQQLDRLRATVKISRTGTGDPLHSIRHTLDLYHSDYLEKFINKASEQLETGTSNLKRAIAELTEQIEQYRLSKIESLKEQKNKRRELTGQRERRAKDYLSAPKLMERTNNDIGKTGVIGEETNRLLMYMVFTSRLREDPLHIISLGASGTGKTYLQEKIAELIPEQDKLEITILSENAFYYFDRKELKNKLVLIEDLDGALDVLYPLRELQSKKKISKTIPVKDSKGNLRTITLHVEGPICLAGTTTMERLYEDNANRSLLIYLDSSKEHNEQIMEYQRKLSAGKINRSKEQELKEFFKDMQTILKPIKARNPYAEYLKLPEYVFKPLRTNAHYLAVIETITFYCQYQREIKTDRETGERYIETTLEDIEWANRLLKDVLLAKADELSGECRRFFENLKSWLNGNKRESFYKSEIRDAFRMNPNNLKYYLSQLLRYNRLKIVGGNRFKSGFEYEVTTTKDYVEINENLTNALDLALNGIKKQMVGNVDNKWAINAVTHSTH